VIVLPATFQPIQTTTLSTAAADVTFSSIPATYTDLRLVFNGGSTGAAVNMTYQYNSDTGSNYSYTYLTGDGASATSSRGISTSNIFVNYYGYMTADNNTNMFIDIFNYSNSTTNKTSLSRANNAGNGTAALVGLWRNTAAITNIKLIAAGSSFRSGSIFTLYGVKAG